MGDSGVCPRQHDSLLVESLASYMNPYAGTHKAITEISYVSLYILPQDSQDKRWLHHFKAMVRNLAGRRWRDAFIQLVVTKNCFVHTVLGKPFQARSKPR